MALKTPYLLFLGDLTDPTSAKTARGLAQWRPEVCLAEMSLPGGTVSLGLPRMSIRQAAKAGARSFVLGAASSGGRIPEHWAAAIVEALDAGLDIVSGLHQRLEQLPGVADCARTNGRRLLNVRHPEQTFAVGTGIPRRGRRLLTVGTDCSTGKMYTSLALTRAMHERGFDVDFRATGQTGILIAGRGVSVDAVVSDFISGAAEWLSPAADSDAHWDVVEGQGSLLHPSFAGVTLGLIHGSQPDALVLCHHPCRTTLRGLTDQPLPDPGVCLEACLEAARLTSPHACAVGVTCNTSDLDAAQARSLCDGLASRLGLPCCDPIRHGVESIVDKLEATFRGT